MWCWKGIECCKADIYIYIYALLTLFKFIQDHQTMQLRVSYANCLIYNVDTSSMLCHYDNWISNDFKQVFIRVLSSAPTLERYTRYQDWLTWPLLCILFLQWFGTGTCFAIFICEDWRKGVERCGESVLWSQSIFANTANTFSGQSFAGV